MDARQARIIVTSAVMGGAFIGLAAHLAERIFNSDSTSQMDEEDNIGTAHPVRRVDDDISPTVVHALRNPPRARKLLPSHSGEKVNDLCSVEKNSAEWLEYFDSKSRRRSRKNPPEELRDMPSSHRRTSPSGVESQVEDFGDYGLFDCTMGSWESLGDDSKTKGSVNTRIDFHHREATMETEMMSPLKPEPLNELVVVDIVKEHADEALSIELLRLMLPEFTTVNGDTIKDTTSSPKTHALLTEGFFDPPKPPAPVSLVGSTLDGGEHPLGPAGVDQMGLLCGALGSQFSTRRLDGFAQSTVISMDLAPGESKELMFERSCESSEVLQDPSSKALGLLVSPPSPSGTVHADDDRPRNQSPEMRARDLKCAPPAPPKRLEKFRPPPVKTSRLQIK